MNNRTVPMSFCPVTPTPDAPRHRGGAGALPVGPSGTGRVVVGCLPIL